MKVRRTLLALATVVAAATGSLTTSTAAHAGNVCPSTDPLSATSTTSGVVSAGDPDWYTFTTSLPREVRMDPGTGGNPDLKIRSQSCASPVCEFNGTAGAEVCSIGPGTYNVGVVHFSSTTGTVGYHLNVSTRQCQDGVDNDGDGATDYPSDLGCSSATDNTEAPNPQCSDGVDNDRDGSVDHPADAGCTGPADTSEGVACQTTNGLVICAGVSAGNEITRVAVLDDPTGPGDDHHVAGYLDVYRFVLPNATVVNLPCVSLVVDAVGVNPCALAGGTFVSRTATLVDVTESEPVSTELVSVGVCEAELVLTVNDIGIPSARALTLC